MNLLLAPSLASVVLVETGKVAVVSLVQCEVFLGRKPGLTDLGKHQVERMLRALQDRREGDVEFQPLRLQLAAGVHCFCDPLLGQVRILPTGEEVLQVPFALAVPHQHKKAIAHCNMSISVRFLDVAEPQHISHGVEARRLAMRPQRRLQRTVREDRPVFGVVRQG